jgi:hypothetical protein
MTGCSSRPEVARWREADARRSNRMQGSWLADAGWAGGVAACCSPALSWARLFDIWESASTLDDTSYWLSEYDGLMMDR